MNLREVIALRKICLQKQNKYFVVSLSPLFFCYTAYSLDLLLFKNVFLIHLSCHNSYCSLSQNENFNDPLSALTPQFLSETRWGCGLLPLSCSYLSDFAGIPVFIYYFTAFLRGTFYQKRQFSLIYGDYLSVNNMTFLYSQ